MNTSKNLAAAFIATSLFSVLALVAGCTRAPKWDPQKIDEGALKQPFVETESGLKWRILREASGPRPTGIDEFNVHYQGWILDENGNKDIFDTSYAIGFVSLMRLDQVVAGFAEGCQMCSVGAMIELEIPPDLGYGAKGNPPSIPPNATLFFRIEMVEVQ
ncbi:MAG: FKBP-type peptidyl-prolyl cis-trans isomerase [Pirellulaceae bacterium]|nr:FKBP-type peptidyl-prolyl cis-trans isomerase [Pirellulaceae bacterium]